MGFLGFQGADNGLCECANPKLFWAVRPISWDLVSKPMNGLKCLIGTSENGLRKAPAVSTTFGIYKVEISYIVKSPRSGLFRHITDEEPAATLC